MPFLYEASRWHPPYRSPARHYYSLVLLCPFKPLVSHPFFFQSNMAYLAGCSSWLGQFSLNECFHLARMISLQQQNSLIPFTT